ncbi:hypothetical protein EVAR_103096_1 [Eumeta japonica]|uniref:Uncharacterized protein n=1 Tax=Eumeta variegata TaxID=151549 RepID=A0A4C1WN03_EUMVA|nr:hypothetical protein EVAR_103096_1 [Eumeta japonica]
MTSRAGTASSLSMYGCACVRRASAAEAASARFGARYINYRYSLTCPSSPVVINRRPRRGERDQPFRDVLITTPRFSAPPPLAAAPPPRPPPVLIGPR